MVKIRLSKTGRKNFQLFRVVVVDDKEKRDGRFIEWIGHYNPHLADPSKKMTLDGERYRHWISVGAQPSDSLRRLVEHTRALDPQAAVAAAPAVAAPEAAPATKAKAKAKKRKPASKKTAQKPASKK
jgi:small subunit ribosomal protein S16